MATQRINPDNLVDLLVSTFGQTSIDQFRKFLAKHPRATKWMIASDFVLNEPQAASDAYAYTFFPYNAEIPDLKAKIAKLAPKDFKKTKVVQPTFHEFLQSGDTFSICLLTPKNYAAAGDIHAIRLSLDATITNMRNWEDADEQQTFIKALSDSGKGLRRETSERN